MKKFLLLGFLLCLAACASTVEQRGVAVDPDKLSQIQIGQSTSAAVASILGSPAATSNFGTIEWYYIEQKMEYWAFNQAKIDNQNVVIVRFDGQGLVSAIERKNLNDAKTVAAVKATTPSAESQLTIMQQLLGNVGRFSGKEGSK